MSETMTDVLKYICEWYRTSQPGASNIALNQADVNLNNIKLKVQGSVSWTPLSDNAPGGGDGHEVTVSGPGQAIRGLDPVGIAYASSESESFYSVSITEGIKGLNKVIKVDLAGTGHKGTLGDYIEIDPSKEDSKIKRDKMRVTVAVEKPVQHEPLVANIRNSHKDYKGQFECIVSMEGIVLMGGGLQHDVFDIFQDLKEPQKPSAKDLQHVKFEAKKVLLPLKGTVQFHWVASESVEVN